jgi:hypothetical protein
MGHVCWALRGTTSHQSVGQGGFSDAPSAQQHDPAAARDDGCVCCQVSVVLQNVIVVGRSQLQGKVRVTVAQVHTIQTHKGPRVRSQGPDQCGTALITDVIVPQAAMYTPTHNIQYSFISEPTTHAMRIRRKQSTPHHPLQHIHACKPTLLCPLPNTSLAPCHIRIQNMPRASHCTALYPPHIRSHFTSAHKKKHPCGQALPPSQPHPTQPAASWLAPSPTTYSRCVNDSTCRRAPAIAAPASGPMPLYPSLSCTHPRTTPTTHSSPNPPTQHVHRTQTIYTSPHTPTHS